MLATNFDIDMLLAMRHSPLHNYVVPGLTSWLIGAPSKSGCIRLFECTRWQQEFIAPHSHRFDFQCWVLAGKVQNRIWHHSNDGDIYQASRLTCEGPGIYIKEPGDLMRMEYSDKEYAEGDCYAMGYREIHSITFSRGALVLFFEGPQKSKESLVLEPYVSGVAIPTFKTEPWMFQGDPCS